MTECQGCGAWNDANRAICVLCGTPLTEIDEWDASATPPPLPPLPDGGLAAAMPSWLREPPSSLPAAAPAAEPDRFATAPVLPPLGPRADPRTFLNDDDFPHWLRGLAARQMAARKPEAAAPASASIANISTPPVWPDWPATAAALQPPAAPAPAAPRPATLESPAAAVPSRRTETRREQPLWVVLLLVLLFLGVAAAALWALLSNGVVG